MGIGWGLAGEEKAWPSDRVASHKNAKAVDIILNIAIFSKAVPPTLCRKGESGQVELGAPSISQEEPLFCDERNERAISLSQAGWGRRTDERKLDDVEIFPPVCVHVASTLKLDLEEYM